MGEPVPVTLPPMPADRVLILESAGAQPEDTTVTVPDGARRVVVLRRGAPDYSLFVQLELPRDALRPAAAGVPATVTLRPRPGLYAVDVEVSGELGEGGGARISFSYGQHFLAPAGARAGYGSDLSFERALAIGRLEEDRVVFLPTLRPGSDMVSAPLTAPGRYLVAAPAPG